MPGALADDDPPPALIISGVTGGGAESGVASESSEVVGGAESGTGKAWDKIKEDGDSKVAESTLSADGSMVSVLGKGGEPDDGSCKSDAGEIVIDGLEAVGGHCSTLADAESGSTGGDGMRLSVADAGGGSAEADATSEGDAIDAKLDATDGTEIGGAGIFASSSFAFASASAAATAASASASSDFSFARLARAATRPS